MKRNDRARILFNSIVITSIGIVVVLVVLLLRLGTPSEAGVSPRVYGTHIQVAVPDNELLFWDTFQSGATEAGEQADTYVEFVPVIMRDADDLEEKVEMAGFAGVDGIAVQAVDTERSEQVVQQAKDAGMGVVTYESGTIQLPGVPTVGTNYFRTGVMAGEMATAATGGNAHALVVLNRLGPENDLQQQNNFMQGVMEGVGETADFTSAGVLVVESAAFDRDAFSEELKQYIDSANVIICLDERSTPAIAQVLVDEGYVGSLKMVGYGVVPQTLEYIKRGVIFGCISPDAYQIGFDTVNQLVGVLSGQQVNEYITPEPRKVDSTNVESYIQTEE